VDLVALGWLALALTGSPFMVGLAAFARTAPMMVVGPFAGIAADQVSPGHVLFLTQVGGAAAALGLALGRGSGALAGALAIAAQRRHLLQERLFGISIVVTPAIVAAVSLSPSLSLCLVLLLVLGFVEAAFAATQSTVVLLSAPEGVRGGTVGILSACIGTQPVGTLAIGALVGIAGVSLAFTMNALSALIVTVPLALWLFRR
jgi:MFS family permease